MRCSSACAPRAISTVLCVIFGVPMAMVLARTKFRGQQLMRSLVLLPLVLPPVVGGIALLYTFGRRGLLGHTFEVLGIQVAFSTTAVVIAQTFVALPFLVVSLEGALRTAGGRYEAVASTLGARPTTVFRRVTLAVGAARAGLGRGARVRPSTGGVRCHHHLRRQPPGRHPHAAAGDLPAAGERRGRRGRAVTAAGGRGDRRHRAGSRAGRDMSLELSATIGERGFDLSMHVGVGETLAVLGPNGSGKSTAHVGDRRPAAT